MFNLAIFFWIMFSSPWFMDLTFRFLCNIVLYSIKLYFHARHIYNWVFPLWPILFILSGAICNCPQLFPSRILDTWSGRLFWCHIFLPFHIVYGVLQARLLEWFAISFSSGPHFLRTLHHELSILGGPVHHGSYLHWVIQAPSPGYEIHEGGGGWTGGVKQ